MVSFGVGCARADYPGIYTRIQHFKDWIANNLEPEETTPMETTQKETTPMDTTQKETTQMETTTEQQTTPTTTSSASVSILSFGTIFIPLILLVNSK